MKIISLIRNFRRSLASTTFSRIQTADEEDMKVVRVQRICLRQQSRRLNSSLSAGNLSTSTEERPEISLPFVSEDERDPDKKRTRNHLRNYGQYFITTPIFYVNGDPHVGHMHSMVVADVHKRYKSLWKKSTLLSTGTDEHGMKVQKAALAKGEDPLAFCIKAAQKFKDLAARINLSDHVFIRTTEERHKIAVQHLWRELLRRGHIYKGTHEGWYSVTDECFYKESQIEDRQDPTGQPIKVAKETGSQVEWTSEENYCFRLSRVQERLKAYYTEYTESIVPRTYYQDVVNALQEPLEDLSISRPRSRLSWGIEVPDDPEQTIYVWFDALINYLTVAGYPFATQETATKSEEGANIPEGSKDLYVGEYQWPVDVHVIGKDIVRFHCIFWPSFLLAANMALPRRILVHGHWTMNGLKMSKSLGNVISPDELLKTYHPDVIRYYMIKEGGQERDGNWNNDSLRNRYTYLGNTWGNLVSRMMGYRMDLESAVKGVFRPDTGEYRGKPSRIPDEDASLREAIDTAINVYMYHMNRFNLEAALTAVDALLREGNRYVTFIKPWEYFATPDRHKFYSVQHQAGEVIRIASILLLPFMPAKANECLDIIGVDPKRRNMTFAEWGKDRFYGRKGYKPGPQLFPRMESPTEAGSENETMEELMKRRRAEKLAAREAQALQRKQSGTRQTETAV